MSVRFKFKNDLEYNTVPCDGFHISVLDLKRTIIRNKRLGRVTDFDLRITNQQTNETYTSEDDLIPKNSTLTIARMPLERGQKKVWEEEKIPMMESSSSGRGRGAGSSFTSNNLDEISEDDKIANMMSNSSEMYDRKNWKIYKGKAAYGGKPPPLAYRCNRCHQTGHWVTDCSLIKAGIGGQELKKTTGIPRSFLKPANIDTPGAKINPQGLYMVNELETQAYQAQKIDKPMWDEEDTPAALPKIEVPEDLKCPVCSDLLKDAIMMPACACATCDECARNALIESDTNACPVCGEQDNCPDDLIPCRKLRDKVNKFKNSAGYSKPKPSSLVTSTLATGVAATPDITTTATTSNTTLTSTSISSETQLPSLPDIILPDPSDAKFDSLRAGGLPATIPTANKSPQPTSAVQSPNYNNLSPYGNMSDAPTPLTSEPSIPLTSEPPIPGVGAENDVDEDLFKSAPIRRSRTPDTPRSLSVHARFHSRSPSANTPSPLRRRIRSRSRSRSRRRSPRSRSRTPPLQHRRTAAPLLPDTSLPPPGFMMPPVAIVPPQYPVPMHGYIPPPIPHMYMPQQQQHRGHPSNRYGNRRGEIPPPTSTGGYIEDPLAAFNAAMAKKDKQKYIQSRSRSRSPYHRHHHRRRYTPPQSSSRYRSSPPPSRPRSPRGPRTPPHPPRQSLTPPPGESPQPCPPGSQSPSTPPPIRQRSRTPPPPPPLSPERRRSRTPSSRRSLPHSRRSRSCSRTHSHSPSRSRYYDDYDRGRSYHPSDPRHPDYQPRDSYNSYRDDHYRGTRLYRGRVRGRGRGRYYERDYRRSPPPLPSHRESPLGSAYDRDHRRERSYSNDRTPSLSPEPQSYRYNSQSYEQRRDRQDYSASRHYERSSITQSGGVADDCYNDRSSYDDRYTNESHQEPPPRYENEIKDVPHVAIEEPPIQEEQGAAPQMDLKALKEKKKKEKKKKKKKDNESESNPDSNLEETSTSKKKKKKSKKMKRKSEDHDEHEKIKKSSSSSHKRLVVGEEEHHNKGNIYDPNERGKSPTTHCSLEPQVEEESASQEEEREKRELYSPDTQISICEPNGELVPELSKWEREELEGFSSPLKEVPQLRDDGGDNEDLKEILKNKKEKMISEDEDDEKDDGDDIENEDEELKKKKNKKKRKQREIEKKIEKRIRKELKKKLKKKLKKREEETIVNEQSSPMLSPSPPPLLLPLNPQLLASPPDDYTRRSRDVQSDKGDSLRITIGRSGRTRSNTPEDHHHHYQHRDRRRNRSRSPSPLETGTNRVRKSLLKLSGTTSTVIEHQITFKADIIQPRPPQPPPLPPPGKKLSIKERLGPKTVSLPSSNHKSKKRSRSRSRSRDELKSSSSRRFREDDKSRSRPNDSSHRNRRHDDRNSRERSRARSSVLSSKKSSSDSRSHHYRSPSRSRQRKRNRSPSSVKERRLDSTPVPKEKDRKRRSSKERNHKNENSSPKSKKSKSSSNKEKKSSKEEKSSKTDCENEDDSSKRQRKSSILERSKYDEAAFQPDYENDSD